MILLKKLSILLASPDTNFLKLSYSDSGYICHIYTRDKLYIYTNHTSINANFQCKMISHGWKCCRHWDSNPQPSDLDHLALGVCHPCVYFTSLRLSGPLSSGRPSSRRQPAGVAPGQPRLCISSLDRGLLQQHFKPQLRGPAQNLTCFNSLSRLATKLLVRFDWLDLLPIDWNDFL